MTKMTNNQPKTPKWAKQILLRSDQKQQRDHRLLLKEQTRGSNSNAVLPRDIIPGFLETAEDLGVVSDPILDVPNADHQVYMCPGEIDLVIRAITVDTHLGLDKNDGLRMWMRQREDRALIVIESTCSVATRFLSAGTNPRIAAVMASKTTPKLDWVEHQVENAGGVFWVEQYDDGDDIMGRRYILGLPILV